MKSSFILYIFLFQALLGISQQKFDLNRLNKSKVYGPEIVSMLGIEEVYELNPTETTGKVFIRNGLRSSSYINPEDWQSINDVAKPERIEIVFSKYPVRENGYQMHYTLLCNRLKKLFEIDPFLNDATIDWKIILQTHCENDDQVDELFHGVVIHFPVEENLTSDSENENQFIKDSLKYEYEPVSWADDSISNLDTLPEKDILEEVQNLNDLPKHIKEQLNGRNKLEQTEILLDYFEHEINSTDDTQLEDIDQVFLERHKKIVQQFIKRFGPQSENIIAAVMDRNPHWENTLVVADWTGSMYQYGAQALEWHILNFEKSGMHYFTLFNDGDQRSKKAIGKTNGVYFEKANNMNRLVNLYNYVMLKGTGGDIPENDLEAVLKGIEHFPDHKDVVLIADNNACVRDMELLEYINEPIHVIICGYTKEIGLNPQYIEIAKKTNGSIHTIEDDIENIRVKLNNRGHISNVLNYNVNIGIAPCFSEDLSIFMPSEENGTYTDLDSALNEKSRVRFLNLSEQGLEKFPKKVLKFKNLQTLNLSNNQLEKIPKSVKNLSALKTINFSHNKLVQIPFQLNEVTFIRNLDLSHNQFERIYSYVFEYKYIEYINLSHNQITELPKNMKARKLKELYVSHNNLTNFPKSLGRSKMLTKLSLAHNDIEYLSKSIGSLKKLEAIDLSYNKLKELPDSFYKIYNPKVIVLTGNPLSESIIKKVKRRWPNANVEF